MKLTQLGRAALASVLHNKMRSFLTMLGLVVGIFSVMLLVGMSDGSSKQVEGEMKELGGDVVSAYLFKESVSFADLADVQALPGVTHVAPSKYVSSSAARGSEKTNRITVEATNEHYLEARNMKLASGRNLSKVDLDNESKVCVIGQRIARDLFGTADALGKTLKVEGHEFLVVGVLEGKGESMGLDTEGIAVIPFTVARQLGADAKIGTLYVKASDESRVSEVKSGLTSFLVNTKQLPSTSFNVTSQDEMLDATSEVSKTMTLLLAGIASISLIVAGIGVMNVMLVSVAERVREIGIKKALGARRIDILAQFLIEALLICVVGGAAGILCGVVAGYAASALGIAYTVSTTVIAGAVIASTAIGLIFGVFPAYRAARLRPIEALRQE